MMCKTIDAIKKHKRAIKFGGIDTCHLDFKGGIGALYMKSNEFAGSPRRHQHQTKQNTIMNMTWTAGEDFVTASAKSKAIKQVEDILVYGTKKSITKSTIVLGDLVSKLTKSLHFDEDSILTLKRRTRNANMAVMFKRALRCTNSITKMKDRNLLQKEIQLLTGVSALFLPLPRPNEVMQVGEGELVSMRQVCKITRPQSQ